MNENGKYGVKTWSQVVFSKRVAHLDGAHANLKKQVEAEYIALDLLLPFTFLGLYRENITNKIKHSKNPIHLLSLLTLLSPYRLSPHGLNKNSY